MLNKNVAGILAIIFGGFGVHRFYLGQKFLGFLRFGAFIMFTMIVMESRGSAEEVFGFLLGMLFLSAAIEGLLFFFMPKDRFNQKYNKHHTRVTAPANVADLKAEGVDYFKSGDYDLAIEAFQDALDVNATDPGVHFNLACAYSKNRSLAPALYHLELSISYGLPDPLRIDQHNALEWLRRQPAYQTFKNQNFRQQLLLSTPPQQQTFSSSTDTASTLVNETKLDLPDINDIPVEEDDLVTRIRKLGKLREQGILTEAEFAEQKEKLLS